MPSRQSGESRHPCSPRRCPMSIQLELSGGAIRSRVIQTGLPIMSFGERRVIVL